MLNRAHWLHRQAEKATRKGNVEEAVKYHKEAADILNQLLQNILDEKVAESLRLQVAIFLMLLINHVDKKELEFTKSLGKGRREGL